MYIYIYIYNIYTHRASKMDLNVEGPWNSEKYYRPTRKIFEF